MLKRILRVFGANIIGQIITILIQVITVPVFLKYWGNELYGEWLIVTALPFYLIVSGSGIGFVAGNSMQKHVEDGDGVKALSVFQSAWCMTLGLSIILFIFVIFFLEFIQVKDLLNISRLGSLQLKSLLIVLTGYVLLTLQTELLGSVYRANSVFARGISILNIIRVIEFFGTIFPLIFGASPLLIALFYLFIRLFAVFYLLIDLKRYGMKIGFRWARYSIVKENLVPMGSFLGFPLGHACMIQGMTTVIGIKIGSNGVVIFSVLRTVVGFIKQFSSAIYYALWPEFSSTISQGKLLVAKFLHRKAFVITLIFSISCALILFFSSSTIISIWTSNSIFVDKELLLLMLISSIPNSLWMMSSYVSISINKHSSIAMIYCLVSGFSMVLAYFITSYLDLLAIPISTILVDLIVLGFVLNKSFQIVEDRPLQFFSYLFSREIVSKRSFG